MLPTADEFYRLNPGESFAIMYYHCFNCEPLTLDDIDMLNSIIDHCNEEVDAMADNDE